MIEIKSEQVTKIQVTHPIGDEYKTKALKMLHEQYPKAKVIKICRIGLEDEKGLIVALT